MTHAPGTARGRASGAPDLLLYAEDPGAANFIAELPGAFERHGLSSLVLACGLACGVFAQRGVAHLQADAADDADALLARHRPRLIVVGTAENPDSLGLRLVTVAAARGVRSLGAVDAAMNAAARFRGRGADPLAHAPDELLVADTWTADAFAGLGYPRGRIVVCGHPHDDAVRRAARALIAEGRDAVRRRVLPGAPQGRAVAVFADEGSVRLGADGPRYLEGATLRGRGGRTGRTEAAMETFLDALAALPERPWCVLRLHPKDRADDFGTLAGEFDAVNAGGDALALVFAADLVVGLTSMLLHEAALLGRATLSIVPHAHEGQWLPGVRAGTTPCVWTQPAAEAALRQWQANPAGPAAAFERPPAASARIARHVVALLRPAPHAGEA